MKDFEPNFVVDERNKSLIAAIYDYIWGKSKILDSKKGLLLWGPIGTGKSTLLKGMQSYLAKVNRYCYACANKAIGFKFTSAVEISLKYSKDGMDGLTRLVDREYMSSLAIDELGKEPVESKHFGTTLNVMQVLLQLRYEVRSEYKTFATTNMNPDTEIVERYGEYIGDRIKEMFNIIEIKGESRRKQ